MDWVLQTWRKVSINDLLFYNYTITDTQQSHFILTLIFTDQILSSYYIIPYQQNLQQKYFQSTPILKIKINILSTHSTTPLIGIEYSSNLFKIIFNVKRSNNQYNTILSQTFMKKDEINKIEHAIQFKKRARPSKNLFLDQLSKQPEKEASEAPSKSKHNYGSEDGKSDTNKSNKQKKTLPTLSVPSTSQTIRKMMVERAFYDQIKNIPLANTFQDKQSLQKQTLSLKQRNNELTVQNMKLKTKIMSLESQNLKLQKIFQEDGELKNYSSKQSKIKSNEQNMMNLKIIIRDTKKQLGELQDQNQRLKKTMKYTRLSQLQQQRKTLQEQTIRLRQLLEEQIAQNISSKMYLLEYIAYKSYNKSQLQQQCTTLQQANSNLKKQVIGYSKKIRAIEEKYKNTKAQPEKNVNRTITDLKRTIKQKTIEIENLKRQNHKDERDTVRSASLNKNKPYRSKCEQCNHKKQQIKSLKAKISQLQEKVKQTTNLSPLQDIVIKFPSSQQVNQVVEFLKYRFKAHRITYQSLGNYLVKDGSENISVGAMVQNLLAQPFFLIHPSYLENIIAYLFYSDNQKQIKVNQSYEKNASEVKASFLSLIKQYELTDVKIQQEIFIQIAQIVTNYCDHISAAFDSKRNGEGTISKTALCDFLKHIQLQEDYIQFIITQIVLESTDLQHLNYYCLFQIFYLPNSVAGGMGLPQAVKELDEQYEQSQQSGGVKGVQREDILEIQNDLEYQQDFDMKEENEEENVKEGVKENVQENVEEEI